MRDWKKQKFLGFSYNSLPFVGGLLVLFERGETQIGTSQYRFKDFTAIVSTRLGDSAVEREGEMGKEKKTGVECFGIALGGGSVRGSEHRGNGKGQPVFPVQGTAFGQDFPKESRGGSLKPKGGGGGGGINLTGIFGWMKGRQQNEILQAVRVFLARSKRVTAA